MKLKLISLLLLTLSLQSFAMEQDNKDVIKEEETTEINPNESLGNLSVLPDELLIQVICKATNSSTYKEALQMLQSLEKTSRQCKTLAYDNIVKRQLTQLKEELTKALITEFDKNENKKDFFLIAQLILAGANVNAKNSFGSAALLSASINGHTDIVKLLLENGANVNIQTNHNKNTALIFASYNGHIDTVKLLLEYNADINIKNALSQPALMCAELEENTDIVNLLRQHGAQ